MELGVCVFCASSEAVAPHLRAVAAELGRSIAARGWRLVYGGGDIGLMGEVARAALAGGAHVTGVMPHLLVSREIELREATELIRVDTMRQRKQAMDERADAFVVLPGGIGTLEELLEILVAKQLGFHDRPIVLLDSDGFWAPLRRQLLDVVAAGLAPPAIHDLMEVTADVEQTVQAITGAGQHPGPVGREALAEAVIDRPPQA